MKILLAKYTKEVHSSVDVGKKGKYGKVVDATETNECVEITNYISTYSWSGSDEQVSRVFEFSMINAPYDPQINNEIPSIAMGDYIYWYDDSDTLIFYGMVYEKETLSATGTEQFTARDMLYHLTQSKVTRKFKKTTPDMLVSTVCKELGVEVGNVVQTGVNVKILASDNTFYEVLRMAYDKAEKNTTWKYKIAMNGKALDVFYKGEVVDLIVLSDESNIKGVTIKESVSDIINSVTAYSESGKKVGLVKDDDSIEKYGVFMGSYTKEQGVKWKSGAKENLVAPSQEFSLEALGTMGCISGYAVDVKDAATGLIGRYWITSDRHTFSNGVHTMSLTLDFNGVMEYGGGEDGWKYN